MVSPLLQVQALAKHYDNAPVFAQVNMVLQPGEFIAIMGDSGVGKSTLLNCIAGLDQPTCGEVRLLNQTWTGLTESEQAHLRRRHLGFVFQAFHVLPHLTVAQNVGLPLLLLGQSSAPRVQTALESVGLAGLAERLPQQLSGGQLQRVAIARALIHRPALILADEPTGNLDPVIADKIMTVLVAQIRQYSAACLMVTHSQAAANHADRILRLTPAGLCEPSLE